jgi:hypothetical protein
MVKAQAVDTVLRDDRRETNDWDSWRDGEIAYEKAMEYLLDGRLG